MQISAQSLLASQQAFASQQTGAVQPRPAPGFSAAMDKTGEFAPVAVTIVATDRKMHAGQSEVFVEVLGHLPAAFAVARGALRAETPLVRIFVARGTIGRCAAVTNHCDRAAKVDAELFRHRLVAIRARNRGVFVFEYVLRILGVIEFFDFPRSLAVALGAIAT